MRNQIFNQKNSLMKKVIHFLVALLLVSGAQAEGCFPEGITFSSQSQINSFRTAFPGCAVIEGDVTISGSGIYNLTGLNIITTINGDLKIECNQILTNLSGLDNLTHIGGALFVEGNFVLASLSGLDNLTWLGGNIMIANNPALGSVEALSGLTVISGNLWIEENPQLSSLEGLNNVGMVEGIIRIAANISLSDLNGFSGLSTVGGAVIIGGQGHLGGTGNPALSDISGLSQLTAIGDKLEVSYNGNLESLSGLDNIAPGSMNGLFIYQNPLLSHCEVASVCGYLAAPGGELYISDNAFGCSSVEEVSDACLIISDPSLNKTEKFNLYPNPAQSEIVLELAEKAENITLEISNLRGVVVFRDGVLSGRTRIDVADFPAGLYLVRLFTPEAAMTRLIVKQ